MVKAIRILIGLICAVMALTVLLAVVVLLFLALVLFLVAFLVVYVVAPEESKAFWGKVRDQIEDWVTRLERLGGDAKTLASQVLGVFPGVDALKKGKTGKHSEPPEPDPVKSGTTGNPSREDAARAETTSEASDTMPLRPECDETQPLDVVSPSTQGERP